MTRVLVTGGRGFADRGEPTERGFPSNALPALPPPCRSLGNRTLVAGRASRLGCRPEDRTALSSNIIPDMIRRCEAAGVPVVRVKGE